MPIPIGDIIKHRRSVLRLTQSELSELSGVALRTIKQIEGRNGNPSLNTLDKIARVMGLEIRLVIKNLIGDESEGLSK